MNKADNLILLNHSLLIENDQLRLQVQVLSHQVHLLKKENNDYSVLVNAMDNMQTENIQLKREILILQEKIQDQEEQQAKSIEQIYLQQINCLHKESEEDIKNLKKEYHDKLYQLQQEKQSLYEQAVAMGIQIQTSKNLEQQTNKIIQISSRLEKILSEVPQNSENNNPKQATAREIYDNLISQLNAQLKKNPKTSDSAEQLFPIVKTPKNSPSQFQKDQQFNIKKFLALTRNIESPRNQGYLNTLTVGSLNKKN